MPYCEGMTESSPTDNMTPGQRRTQAARRALRLKTITKHQHEWAAGLREIGYTVIPPTNS